MQLNIRPVSAPTITNLTATAAMRSVNLKWDLPSDPTYAGAEIWTSGSDTVGTATLKAQVLGNTYTDSGETVNPAADRYYWVRAINIYGRSDGSWSNRVMARSLLAGDLDIAAAAVKASNLDVAAIDSATGKLTTGSVSAEAVADGAINTAKFAAGIEPVGIVTALPTVTGYTGPKVVMFSGKIYRLNGTTWTTAVATSDLSGTVSSAQIANGAISATKFASGIEPISIVSALPSVTNYAGPKVVMLSTDGKLYRYSSGAWTSAIPSTDISGTIAAAQIEAIEASKVTGQLTDAQLTAIDAAKVAGQLTSAQIADIASTKITGTLTNAQIAALDAAKLTGTLNMARIATGALDATKFASAIAPVGMVSALPTVSGYTGPKVVMLSTDNKLYRYTGTAWTAAVPAADLSGTVAGTQIANGAITSAKMNVTIGGGNYAINSSMEVDSDGNGWADGWNAYAGFDTPVMSTDAFHGKYSQQVRVSVASTNNRLQMVKNRPFFAAGTPVTISGYLKVPAGSNLYLSYKLFNAVELGGETYSAAVASSLTSSGAWQRISLSFAMPIDGYLSPMIGVSGAAIGTIVKIDAVQIEVSDVLTAYAPKADEILPNSITATEIANDAITSAKIIAGAVVAGKIATGAIEADKIAAGAVTTAKLAAGAVTANEIAANTITAAQIAADTITAGQIAAGAINASELAADAVTAGKIAANAVTATTIAADAVTTAKIAAGAVTATEIAAGAIVASKLAIGSAGSALNLDPGFEDPTAWSLNNSGTIVALTDGKVGNKAMRTRTGGGSDVFGTKFVPVDTTKQYRVRAWVRKSATANGTLYLGVQCKDSAGANVQGNGTYWYVGASGSNNAAIGTDWTEFTGTLNVSGATVFNANCKTMTPIALMNYQGTAGYMEIQDLRVEEVLPGTLIQNGAITTAKIAANAVTANEIAAKTITAAEIKAATITGAELIVDAITTREIKAGAVTSTSLATGAVTAGKIAAGTIVAADIAASTITGAKIAANTITATQIAADTITAAEIAAGAISATEIATGAVVTDKLAANAVTAAKIAANTITAGQIAAGAISATEIASNAITTDKLNASAVTAAKIATDAVTADKVQANAITTGKLAANAVTAAKIAAGTITATEIASDAITSAKISAGAITAAKIAAGTITADKIDARGLSIKDAAGNVILNAGSSLQQQARSNPNLCCRFSSWVERYNATPGYSSSDIALTNGTYLYISDDGEYNGAVSLPLNIQAGTMYTVSFDAYVQNGDGRILNVDVFGGGIDTAGTSVALTQSWKHVKFTEIMPNVANAQSLGRLRMFATATFTGSKKGIVVANVKVEIGPNETPWCESVITPDNVAEYVAPNAIGNTQIGGDLFSTNWNWRDDEWGQGWMLRRDGVFFAHSVKLRGALMSSNMNGFGGWPAAGAGRVAYFGPEGFQLGNNNDGRYIHAYSNGDLHMPGFRHVDGQLTLERPIIINPQTQTSLSVTLSNINLRNRSNTYNYEQFTVSASPAGVTGNLRYQWSFNVIEGDAFMVSEPSAANCTFKCRGQNISVWVNVSLLLMDDSGAVITRSTRCIVGYGTAT